MSRWNNLHPLNKGAIVVISLIVIFCVYEIVRLVTK